MQVQGSKILILGGYGLVGMAVARKLLVRKPAQIVVHSLRQDEAEEACRDLEPERGHTELVPASGDIFSQPGESESDVLAQLAGQLSPLRDEMLPTFALYRLLRDTRPDIVIDCVNTATGIAYRDIFKSSQKMLNELSRGNPSKETAEVLLDSLYIPRLIRHIQVLYRGMTDVDTSVYMKVGTTGTGGMGLNVPYTHSEEKPSRTLLSKSAMAGAHSMLLFLMARTPDAPITKELKPAAAIAWKKIGYGKISRKGQPIRMVDARPKALSDSFSTYDPDAATERDETLESVYIDTGENGIFSLEEFSALTTGEQMEFVTPEEIAQNLVFELEGGNTGQDVINALDNVSIGPSYRAGLMRHWALERMEELEREHGVHSVAFEMLGPPRLSKLLFEAHLWRLAYKSVTEARDLTTEDATATLNKLVREDPEVANRIVAVGIPILLGDGEVIRGPRVIIPSEADETPITAERLESWVHDGWVDLRSENVALWIDRFNRIHEEIESLDPDDSSSRKLRSRRFWHDELDILPGKIAGWIFAEEEKGARMK